MLVKVAPVASPRCFDFKMFMKLHFVIAEFVAFIMLSNNFEKKNPTDTPVSDCSYQLPNV